MHEVGYVTPVDQASSEARFLEIICALFLSFMKMALPGSESCTRLRSFSTFHLI